ncbi:MAG: hypothetical protein FJ104_11265, partial [Deltaproteobacteria bacterium]|nr:hypothetical protein [Deltaproteobacteria bacterium]
MDRLGAHAAPKLRSAMIAGRDETEIASKGPLEGLKPGEPEALVDLEDVSSPRLRKALAEGRENGYVIDGESLFVYTRLPIEDWVLI